MYLFKVFTSLFCYFIFISLQKLYELATSIVAVCTIDRSLEKLNTKITTIDNLPNNLDKLDDDYNSLFRLADTIVFD